MIANITHVCQLWRVSTLRISSELVIKAFTANWSVSRLSKVTAPGLVHSSAENFIMAFPLSDLCYITYTAFHLMFTLRHSVEINPGKINVFIKSCTVSLKLNDWLHYSPLFTQLKKLIYKIQFPLSRPSMVYVNFF